MKFKARLISLFALFLAASLVQAQTTVSTSFDTSTWAVDGGYSTFVEVNSSAPQFSLSQGAAYGAGGTAGIRSMVLTAANVSSVRYSAAVRKQITSTAATSGSIGIFETSIMVCPKELDDHPSGLRTGELRLGFSSNASNPSTNRYSALSYLEANCISLKLAATHDVTGTTNTRRLTTTLHNSSSSITTGSSKTLDEQTDLYNHWLKLTLTIVRGSGNNYTVSYKTEDLGEDGLATATVVEGLSLANVAMSNSNLGTATSLFGAFISTGFSNPNPTGDEPYLWMDNYSYTTTAVAPNAPTALPATVITTTDLTANWQAADTGMGASSYVVELSKESDNFAPNTFISAAGTTGQAAGVSASITSQVFTGLQLGTSYAYRVRATNSAGDSAHSNVISVSTSATNIPPTLNAITALPTLAPSSTRTVSLSGITNGGDAGQVLTVTAVSSNPAVLPDPAVTYVSPNTSGTLLLSPTNIEGAATVTVTVSDTVDTVIRSFEVHVGPPPQMLNFDTDGTLAEFTTANTTSAISYSATGGMGDPGDPGANLGGMRFVSNSTGEVRSGGWRDRSYNFGNATYLHTSIMVKMSQLTKEGEARIGFAHGAGTPSAVVSNKDWLKKAGTGQFISAMLKFKDNGTKLETMFGNKTGSSESDDISKQELTVASTLKNNWLKISLTLTPTGSGGCSATCVVENMGLYGIDAPAEIRTFTSTLTNAAVLGSTNGLAAFMILGKENSASAEFFYDNHEVVVENSPPGPPVADAATDVGATLLKANWQRVTGTLVTGYLVELSTAADNFAPDSFFSLTGTPAQTTGVQVTGSTTVQAAFTGLPPGTDFVYRVKAYNGSGESEASNVIALRTYGADENIQPYYAPIPAQTATQPGLTRAVTLTGITAGIGETQPLTFTGVSSNTEIVAHPTVAYTQGQTTATLTYQTLSTEGPVDLTITLDDGGSTNNTFSRVLPIIVKQPPLNLPFDTEAEYTNDTLRYASGYSSSWQANAGTGYPAGGGVRLASTTNGDKFFTSWRAQPYYLPGTTYLQTSVLVNLATVSKEAEVRVGFVTGGADPGSATNKNYLEKDGTERSIAMMIKAKPGSGDLESLLLNRSSSSDAGESGSAENLNMAVMSQWARLTLTLIPTGTDTFLASYKIEILGTDGLAAPEVIRQSTPTTLTNAALRSATSAYAVYHIKGKEDSSTVYFDDHTAEVLSLPPPAPVAGETLVRTASSLRPSWVAGAGTVYLSGYVLEVTTAADDFAPGTFIAANGTPGQATGIALTGQTTLSQVMTYLDPSTTYRYRVRASNQGQLSEPSNVIEVTTLNAGENAQPTLAAINTPLNLNLNATQQTVALTGISDGGEATQTLVVTATSSNTGVIPHPTVAYTSPNATATLTFTPNTGATGSVDITVTVNDGASVNNTVTRTFTVMVTSPTNRITLGALTTGANAVGSIWKYLDTGSNEGTAWKENAYDDSTWKSGRSELGYGESGQATTVGYGTSTSNRYITTYFRHAFTLDSVENIQRADFRMKFDDGAVVYLNGTEIYRVNMPDGLITHTTLASSEAAGDGNVIVSFSAPASLLLAGTNVVAVEMHQNAANSNDLTMDLDLNTAHFIPVVPVTTLPADRVSSIGLRTHWSIPANAQVLGYIVEVTTAADNFAPGTFINTAGQGGQSGGISVPAGQLKTQIYDLAPSTEYVYRVLAAGPQDPGIVPNVISATTLASNVNAPPTLDALANATLLQDPPAQTVNLTGISDGGEYVQMLTFTATSSDPVLVPSLSVTSYNFSAETALLNYTVAPGLAGTATITITVDDGEGANNLFSRSFTLTVSAPDPQIQVVALPGSTPAVNGGSLTFPAGPQGVAQTLTLQINSAGNVPLTGLARTLTGDSDFTVSAFSGSTLAAGASTTLTVTFTPTTAGARSGVLNIASNDAGDNPFVINLSGTGQQTPQQSWRETHFGSSSNTGDAADDADPDGDGIPNLLEFALGLTPKEANNSPTTLDTSGLSGGTLIYNYTRSKTAYEAGLTFIVEFSDTLVDAWSTEGVTATVTSDNGTLQQVQAVVPAGANGHRFIRLRVNAAP